MNPTANLEIGGLVTRTLQLSQADLGALPASAQVADVAALVPGRTGAAVRLAALLERARVAPGARFLDVASSDPGFAISVPLAEVQGALIVYAAGGAPLAAEKGGPFRLLVPGHADECVHVKSVARLSLSAARGRDTRPVDDAEHAKLHAKKKS
jgi:DMSO/TMAO reductase YedYZ molybdopterin-dependent catalytic subunit